MVERDALLPYKAPVGARFIAPEEPETRQIDDRTVVDTAGFGASLALAWGCLHVEMLNSRAALAGMPVASAIVLAAFVLVACLARTSVRKRGNLAGALALVAGGVCAVMFAFVFDPTARTVLFCAQQAFAGASIACWMLKALGSGDLRGRLVSVGSGCALAGVVGVAAFGFASSLGWIDNVAVYTTFAICCYGIVALVAGVVLVVTACRGGGLDESSPYVKATSVGARFIAPGNPGRAGSMNRAPTSNQAPTVGARFIAPAQPGNPSPSARAQAAMFAAICLAGVAVSFFDGVTFNPYVHDMPLIELIANAICLLGGLALVACARARNDSRIAAGVFGCIAVFLALAILGIALVSASMEGAGLPIGIIEGSSALLLCAGAAHLSTAEHVSLPFTLAALVCCASPWAMSCGLAVKRSVGYSLATITPIVLVAIAALSIASLVLNAQSARNVSAMQHDHELELTRQQRDFAAVRSADRKRAAAQIERERQMRERAVEAARQEAAEIASSTSPSERFAQMLAGFGLTERESEVVMMAAQGHTIQGIGVELGIAKQTVNYHLHNIYRKLGVESKSEMLTFVNAAANAREATAGQKGEPDEHAE